MFVCIFSFIFLYWFSRYIIFPLGNLFIKFYILTLFEKYVKIIQKSGKWAVVTGATDGIGREYCRQLAKLGLNIFLISRDEGRLELTSKELKQYYKIDVKYFKADFTSDKIYESLYEVLKDLDIGVLVNNVGMSVKYTTTFQDLNEDASFFSKIICCNILSMVGMTKLILSGMCHRKRGIVINISSASSLFPIPMSGIYSSTKAFMTQFSQIISAELSNSGVIVQTVLPFFVQTKFIGNYKPPRIITATAEEFVQSAIKTVGIETYTFGTVGHSIQGILISSLPLFLQMFIAERVQKTRPAYKKD